MKHFMIILLVFLLVLGVTILPGGQSYADKANSLQEFEIRSNGKVKVILNDNRQGPPSFVSGILSEKMPAANADNATRFLEKHNDFFKIDNPGQTLHQVRLDTDELGMTHIRMQQMKNGIPVDRNEISVHFNADNVITTVSGRFDPIIDALEFGTEPVLNEFEAIDAASLAVDAPKFIDFVKVDLIIYTFEGNYYLAYRVNLEFLTGEVGNWFIYVDALDGNIVDKYNAMTGLGNFSDILPVSTYVEPAATAAGGAVTIQQPSPTALLNAGTLRLTKGVGIGVKGDQKHINIMHSNRPGRIPIAEDFDASSLFSSNYNPVASRIEFKEDNTLTAVKYKVDATGEYTLNIKSNGGAITYQTVTITNAPAESWIQFNINPIVVKAEDRLEFEIIKPANSRTIAATSRYNGTYWRVRDTSFGSLGWGYNYSHAMGFVFDGFYVDAGSKFYLIDTTIPNMGGIFTYNLKNATAGGGLYENTNASWRGDVYSGDSSSWLAVGMGPGVDAHVNARTTYDYYLNNHGRNSIDGNGMAIISRVHYSTAYNNAFWSGGPNYMTYGDGDGSWFIPLTDLTVVAHELTHGVTQFMGGLRYRFETGAINEAFSDVFGTLVHGNTWDVGEDIMGEEQILAGRTALRSNSDPGKFPVSEERIRFSIDGEGRFPAHMDEYYYLPQNIDNGGVHVNCTILQHSAYRVAEVYGMGRKVVADTWYRSYMYLHYDAGFADFREAILQSATDLYGADSDEYAAFLAAFDDIGLYEGWTRFDNPRLPLW